MTSLQVFELVGLTELYYAGSHGMDIIGPVNAAVSDDHANCIESTDLQVCNDHLCSSAELTGSLYIRTIHVLMMIPSLVLLAGQESEPFPARKRVYTHDR